jgi:hypothetical protein
MLLFHLAPSLLFHPFPYYSPVFHEIFEDLQDLASPTPSILQQFLKALSER